MAYELTGIIKEIFDEQTFPSGFSKREFVVTTEGDRFPQDIKLECLKERTSLLETCSTGQRVTVAFDLAGREWQGKYFVNLTAWKITPADGDAPASSGNIPSEEEEEIF